MTSSCNFSPSNLVLCSMHHRSYTRDKERSFYSRGRTWASPLTMIQLNRWPHEDKTGGTNEHTNKPGTTITRRCCCCSTNGEWKFCFLHIISSFELWAILLDTQPTERRRFENNWFVNDSCLVFGATQIFFLRTKHPTQLPFQCKTTISLRVEGTNNPLLASGEKCTNGEAGIIKCPSKSYMDTNISMIFPWSNSYPYGLSVKQRETKGQGVEKCNFDQDHPSSCTLTMPILFPQFRICIVFATTCKSSNSHQESILRLNKSPYFDADGDHDSKRVWGNIVTWIELLQEEKEHSLVLS